MKDLASRRKIMVAQTAPAVRVALGEELNLSEGENTEGRMVQALRQVGFDYVFDTNFSADLTIMEEGTELISRLNSGGPFPMFTSCCPGWVNLAEKKFAHLLPNLSTARSPQQMLGSMIKTYFAQKLGKNPEDISVVSIMPCTAKKHEAARPEFAPKNAKGEAVRDVDHVLTTRELGHLLRVKRVPYASLKESDYDPLLGMSTGAGALFGNSGGVTEAAVRTAQVLTGVENPIPLGHLKAVRGLDGVKTATVELKTAKGDTVNVKVAVVNGGKNVNSLLKAIDEGNFQADFVEVMICPGGCIAGGGQPKSKSKDVLQKRMNAIYDVDQRSTLRMSHENPMITDLYKNFLGHPGSEKAHHLLHTHYQDRSKDSTTPMTRGDGHVLKHHPDEKLPTSKL
jgi:iron-only hydrogenase group A